MTLKELIDSLTEISMTHPGNAPMWVTTSNGAVKLRHTITYGGFDMAVILEGED
jgi:hypothetical protein